MNGRPWVRTAPGASVYTNAILFEVKFALLFDEEISGKLSSQGCQIFHGK
jgi:hypothetical protein